MATDFSILYAQEAQDTATFLDLNSVAVGGGFRPWTGRVIRPRTIPVEDAIVFGPEEPAADFYGSRPEFNPIFAMPREVLRYPSNRNMIIGNSINNVITELLL